MSDRQIKTPCNETAEKNIISNLIEQGMHLEGAETLTPEHFFNSELRLIFKQLQNFKEKPDREDLVLALAPEGGDERVRWDGLLWSIYGFDGGLHNYKKRLEALHIALAKRKAISAALNLLSAAQDPIDNESFLAASLEPMTEIHDIAAVRQDAKTKKQIVSEIMKDFAARCEGVSTSMGIPTPFASWNEHLRGIHTKRIYVIQALPASGKSLIAGQLALEASMNKAPALFISVEMPAKTLLERAIVSSGHLPAQAFYEPKSYALREGKTKPERGHLMKIKESAQGVLNSHLHIEDPGSCSLPQALNYIRKHVRENKVKVVVFDFIQRLKHSSGDSMEQHLAKASSEFQAIAKDLDIAIIILSQENKEGGTKHAEAINEVADHALSILKDRDPKSSTCGDWTGLWIRKDRHYGEGGRILPIYLEKDMLRFKDDPFNHHNQSAEL